MRVSDWSSDVCSSDLGGPLLDGPADRQVAVPGVVGAGLVGDGVGAHAAFDQSGQDFHGVAEQCDGLGFAGLGVPVDAGERVVEVGGMFVEIGRGSGWESSGRYVEISGGAGSIK